MLLEIEPKWTPGPIIVLALHHPSSRRNSIGTLIWRSCGQRHFLVCECLRVVTSESWGGFAELVKHFFLPFSLSSIPSLSPYILSTLLFILNCIFLKRILPNWRVGRGSIWNAFLSILHPDFFHFSLIPVSQVRDHNRLCSPRWCCKTRPHATSLGVI